MYIYVLYNKHYYYYSAPDSSPTNLKLVEISNDSAVISFDEVPLKLANGEIAYSANLTAVTSPVYSQVIVKAICSSIK